MLEYATRIWSFMRDNASIASVIIGALTLLTPLAILYIQNKRKRLSIDILSTTALLSLQEERKGNFRLIHKGYEIANAYILTLSITNDGNVPIVRSDYERNVSIEFSEGGEILSVETMQTHPNGITVEYTYSESAISVRPMLLNPGDRIVLRIISNAPLGRQQFNCRISGVKKVTSVHDATSKPVLLLVFGICLIVSSFLIFALVRNLPDGSIVRSLLVIAIMALSSPGIILSYEGTSRIKRALRIRRERS